MKPLQRTAPAPHHGMPRPAQAGAASLIVVMVLFFLMSLVAAYTSRNLIFEQRTSVNQYRSTQAYEAAEAGLEWALSMLNSGRIGADCLEASATASDTTFRQRYLDINVDTGVVSRRVGPPAGTPPAPTPLWPSCVSNGAGGWNCSCPSTTAPSLTAPTGTGVFPAFRVRFTSDELTRPGLIRIESNGCTKMDNTCLNHSDTTAVELEGRANVAAIVALASALPTPPGAALTLLNGAAVGSVVNAYNTNANLGGITVQAGGGFDISGPPNWTLRSVPGTPARDSVVSNDPTLSALAGTPDRAFAATFNMWPATYSAQPAAIRLTCDVAGCRQALADAVAKNPDRVIWVTSPNGLTLESAGTIGSATEPATIVVDGPVKFTATGVRINGFLYARGGGWTGAGTPGEVHGAVFVEGDLAATAGLTVVMNNDILRLLRARSGSFVRAPGGWDDFRGRAP